MKRKLTEGKQGERVKGQQCTKQWIKKWNKITNGHTVIVKSAEKQAVREKTNNIASTKIGN